MTVAVAETEPLSFRSGDFVTWTKSLPDTPANDGWSLAYTLMNAAAKISITTTPSGALFLVSVSAAASAAYTAGTYGWMARVTKATEVYTVGEGTMEVLPNLAALTVLDTRSVYQQILDAIEAAMQGRASSLQLSMEIMGRKLEYMSALDMIRWHGYYKSLVAQEAQAATLAQTGINTNRIGVRLKRV